MNVHEFVLLGAVVAIAAFVQGTIGIGFALVAAPAVALLRPQLLPTSLLILMLPLNLFALLRERHAVDWKGASWITLGRLVGTAAGVSLLAAVSVQSLNRLVGGATILAAAATWIAPAFLPNRSALVAVGLVTGATETATGVGGPPLALAYQHQQPDVFRSSVAACFLIGELLSLAVLAALHRITVDQVTAAGLLLPFLLVGGWASSAAHERMNGRVLRALVLGFAIVSGIILVVRS